MQFTDESFVVLWSPHQDSVQIETVKDMLETNHKIFLRGEKGDFIVLAISDTHDGARAFSADLRRIRDERAGPAS